jgi:Pyruvate/2-oxoacid:ferredoxin oxidoreductase delta subunit
MMRRPWVADCFACMACAKFCFESDVRYRHPSIQQLDRSKNVTDNLTAHIFFAGLFVR